MDKLAARLLACVALAGLGALPEAARADDLRKRVVVLRFSGVQAGRARLAAVTGLKRHANVIDETDFSDALSTAQGATMPDRIASTCEALGVDAVVEGEMQRARRSWTVHIWVRDCSNGEKMIPGGRATFMMRNLGGVRAIASAVWSRLGGSIAEAGGAAGRTRVASRQGRSPDPPRPRSEPPPRARRAGNDLDECLFTEDEPPEGFPSHGDWVRRRNQFLQNCERERTRRAAAVRRAREEADRLARQEAERRIREEERRRAAAERRAREERERRAREEEELAAAAAREVRRRAQEGARREEEERLESRRALEAEDRQREEEALVAAYRERLRRARARHSYASVETPEAEMRTDVEPGSYDDPETSYGDPPPDDPDRDPVYDPVEEEDPPPRRRRARTEITREPEPDPPARTRPTVFHIGAGVSFMNRNMTVEVNESDKPRTYSAPGYPELTVAAELFPAALSKSAGAAAGLGVFAIFRRHLYLQTSGPSLAGGVQEVPTAEQELLGGALFRVAMGSARTSPIFSLSLGYGYFVFQLDPEAMAELREDVQMATMYYTNVVGTAGVTIPVSGPGLGIDLGGSYRYVIDIGQLAKDWFGADSTGGYGFGAHGGLHGEAAFVAEGLGWAFSIDYMVFNTEFSGPSTCAGGALNCFPSGSDRYIRGMFLASYRYR